jgi:hypothetical protein
MVEGFGYDGKLFIAGNFGAKFKFSADVFLGYEAPLTYYSSSGNNILFTPKFYVEAATHNYLDIGLGLFWYRINLDFVGFRYDFAQPIYRQSIDTSSNYCYGMDWERSGGTLSISTEEFANECEFGLIGMFTGHLKDCRKRRYIPDIDAYDNQYYTAADASGSYVSFTCQSS